MNKKNKSKRTTTKHPFRIAIIGKQRTGKDTLADFLESRYNFTKVALADKIREIARDLFSMKEKDRQLLIDIGEQIRAIDTLIWCKYVIKEHKDDELLVISDVRMTHEYDYLREKNFVFIKLHTSDYIRTQREDYHPEAESSRTEKQVEMLDGDITILNDGTLTEFLDKAERVIESLINERRSLS